MGAQESGPSYFRSAPPCPHILISSRHSWQHLRRYSVWLSLPQLPEAWQISVVETQLVRGAEIGSMKCFATVQTELVAMTPSMAGAVRAASGARARLVILVATLTA